MFDLTRLLNVLSSRAGTTGDFQRMLDWKLLRGSHEFPGPDGGTCINEAAIVAAGYPYRPIYRVRDLPACFSRPIALFALCLNDTLDDDLRQELLVPFVTRLAGSADVAKVEMARAELMLRRMVDRTPGAGARARRLRGDRRTVPVAAHADGTGRDREEPAQCREFRAAPAPDLRARSRGGCRPAMAVRLADRSRVLHILRAAGHRHARGRSHRGKDLSPRGCHSRRRDRDRKPGGYRRQPGGRQTDGRRQAGVPRGLLMARRSRSDPRRRHRRSGLTGAAG